MFCSGIYVEYSDFRPTQDLRDMLVKKSSTSSSSVHDSLPDLTTKNHFLR